MATKTLFTLEIPPAGGQTKSSGTFLCTSPSPNVYILTFVAPPDNRLVSNFCQTFLLALDIIEFSYPPGVVITTSGIPKFYSNGLDLEHAGKTEGYWTESLFKLFARFLTYPMPTIAVMNGHAFAGGLMLAMYHDYRVFNPSRGFLCLNELDFGYPLKPAMSSIFKQKIPYPTTYRTLILEAKRIGAKEGLESGIVDVLGGVEEAMKLVEERRLTEKGKSGIYGIMKGEMYRETLGLLLGHEKEEKRDEGIKSADEERKRIGKGNVLMWEEANGKSRSKL